MTTPAPSHGLPSETLLSVDFQNGVKARLQARLTYAERLLNQASRDVHYWGNQTAIALQSLERFAPHVSKVNV